MLQTTCNRNRATGCCARGANKFLSAKFARIAVCMRPRFKTHCAGPTGASHRIIPDCVARSVWRCGRPPRMSNACLCAGRSPLVTFFPLSGPLPSGLGRGLRIGVPSDGRWDWVGGGDTPRLCAHARRRARSPALSSAVPQFPNERDSRWHLVVGGSQRFQKRMGFGGR